jgi:hypothetical protein
MLCQVGADSAAGIAAGAALRAHPAPAMTKRVETGMTNDLICPLSYLKKCEAPSVLRTCVDH